MSVVQGNFKQKATVRSAFKNRFLLTIDAESEKEYERIVKILRDYNIGISSRLYIMLSVKETKLKGKHAEEVVDLIENKGVFVYGLLEGYEYDYSRPTELIYGYLERGLQPVLYPIMPNSMHSEAAGIKMLLPFILDEIKGPSVVYVIGEKIMAVEVLFNTVDETYNAV